MLHPLYRSHAQSCHQICVCRGQANPTPRTAATASYRRQRNDAALPRLFLRWRHGRRIASGRAEDAGIVLLRAAVALELVGISAQRIGLAQIAENPAAIGVVDNGQRLLRRLAEAIEGGA